jgi:hypothetical protein
LQIKRKINTIACLCITYDPAMLLSASRRAKCAIFSRRNCRCERRLKWRSMMLKTTCSWGTVCPQDV